MFLRDAGNNNFFMSPSCTVSTPEARARLLSPHRRGRFWPDQAADRRLGLLTASGEQATVYWLVDPKTRTIQETRFLAYGDNTSVPIIDSFCEMAEHLTLEQACSLANRQIADDLGYESVAEGEFAFLEKLRGRIISASLEIPEPNLAKPYRRKSRELMDDSDRAWLPLSAPAKIVALQKEIASCLQKRTHISPELVEVYNVHNDLAVSLRFHPQVPRQERPTLLKFLNEACRSSLHPSLNIHEVPA